MRPKKIISQKMTDKIIEYRDEGLTYKQIKKKTGLSINIIWRALRENKFLNEDIKPFDLNKALEMKQKGMSYTAIAKEFKLPYSTLYSKMHYNIK